MQAVLADEEDAFPRRTPLADEDDAGHVDEETAAYDHETVADERTATDESNETPPMEDSGIVHDTSESMTSPSTRGTTESIGCRSSGGTKVQHNNDNNSREAASYFL